MKAQDFTNRIDDLRQGLTSILYEMEQMLRALSELRDLGQGCKIRKLSLGTEIALLESFLVHIRNLADVFSNQDPGPDTENILCEHYGFPRVTKQDVLDTIDRKLINTYMAHPSYGRGCPTDCPVWDLLHFRLIYKRSLKFLCHVRDNKPQLVDVKERERIEKLRRDLKAILDCIPSPGKTDKHREPSTEAFTSSSDSPH